MVEIKGAAIIDSIRAVKKRSGEQVYHNIISQLGEEARQLFEKPIIMTGWYPLDLFTIFLALDIKLTANDDENELIKRSEDLIEKHLKGIYKIFIKFGSPEFVINRISTVHMGYFRGVSIKMKFEGSNNAIITYIGFKKQQRLIELIIIGFYRKALEMSGAKDIHAKFLTSIEEGKGYCELELTWKKK